MEQVYLPKNVYKLASYSLQQEGLEKHRKKYEVPVRHWDMLKRSGVSDNIISEIVGISRATYYRHKKKMADLARGILPKTKRPRRVRVSQITESIKQRVLQIRRENPSYGKNKIHTIMVRDYGVKLSESTIGRIIKELMNRGLIQTSKSAFRRKRKRCFKKHAKRWKYGMKAQKPGQMIQIDHMSISRDGVRIKHFQAWDPITKYIYADVFSNASSKNARIFLNDLINHFKFPIHSIQVDGGSEFMAEFEEECQKFNIDLYVLPPKRPQYNGGVERANRTFKEEFYRNPNLIANERAEVRIELRKALEKYNNYRPHFALDNLTPNQYIQNIMKAA